MKNNYHSHTLYCHHASQSPEEIVKLAIKKKYKNFGFSEHCYLDGKNKNIRLSKEDEKKFINEINLLKNKYKDKINIFCSFECDLVYTENKRNDFVDYVAKKRSMEGIDYLIIGHHLYPSGNHTFSDLPKNEKDIEDYLNLLEKALKTGAFSCLAHPDGFMGGVGNNMKLAKRISEGISNLLVKYDVPGGLNVNGIVQKRKYPSLFFWKIAAKKNVKAILELDNHDARPFKKKYIEEAKKIARKSKVILIDTLKF